MFVSEREFGWHVSHGALENGKSDLLNWQDKQRSLPGPRIDSIKTNVPGNANGELCTLRVNPNYYSSRRPSEGSRSMTSPGKFISPHVWKKISLCVDKNANANGGARESTAFY